MRLYRSFATVGGLTLISRLLGFARDVLIANVLGTGFVADAFIVAFRLPNLFRRLFAEGAFNSAFVPLFAKELAGDDKAVAKAFAEEALSVLLAWLVAFSAIAIILMPWLMYLLAAGYADTPEKFDLAVLMSRIAFPYLLCMSLMALFSGVLSGLGRFAAASAAQILLNVVLTIVMAVVYFAGLANTPEAGIWLCFGVTAAGVLQLAMLARDSARAGMLLDLKWPRLTPGVRRLIALAVPALIAGGITQINIVVGTNIASLQDGAVSYLYYADRLYQLPLGIVGIAIGIVLLPDIARLLREQKLAEVHQSQNRSLEFSLLLTLPAAAALAAVPSPLVSVLFERGAFTAADTPPTAMALAAFSWGLPAFVLNKVLSPAFFAREDTQTPMQFALVNLVINVAGSLALFYLFRAYGLQPFLGIAVATTVAAWINVIQLWVTLGRRGHFATDPQLSRNLPRIVVASLLMAAVLVGAFYLLEPWFARANGPLVQFAALAALVMSGLVSYALAVLALGVARLSQLKAMLASRPQRTKGGGAGGFSAGD